MWCSYTSKELADWIQSWAEQQELTVSVILHRILRNSYQKAQRQGGRAAVDGPDRSAVMPAPSGVLATRKIWTL